MQIISKLTVLFENPFWIGIFELSSDNKLRTAKVTFGAEPKDTEIYYYILKYYNKLDFSPFVSDEKSVQKHINPKRMQRIVKKETSITGIGTKSQQALKLMQEQNKKLRQSKTKEQRLCEKQKQFELHIEKKKEKHRGH